MKELLEQMKDITFCAPVVTIKSTPNENTIEELKNLAEKILEE